MRSTPRTPWTRDTWKVCGIYHRVDHTEKSELSGTQDEPEEILDKCDESVCFKLNMCLPPQIHTFNLMVCGGGASGRGLSHKGGALMNGTRTIIKEIPRNSLAPSSNEDTVRRQPFMNQDAGLHQTTSQLMVWSWTCQSRGLWVINFYCL